MTRDRQRRKLRGAITRLEGEVAEAAEPERVICDTCGADVHRSWAERARQRVPGAALGFYCSPDCVPR
jgi:hypothetical protein